MLFFPRPLRLYLGLKTLGLIPAQVCPLLPHRLQHTQTCLVRQVFQGTKMGGVTCDPRGVSPLSASGQKPQSAGSGSMATVKFSLSIPPWGLYPALGPGEGMCQAGGHKTFVLEICWLSAFDRCFLNCCKAVVLGLCEVTNSTPLLCGGKVCC